jgi:nucleoside-diphosphate-sugar epimerase
MKVLVTGASGYLGNRLAHRLADNGVQVNALVRPASARNWLPHPRIQLFAGDILDAQSLAEAIRGCSQVYHAAAKTGAWDPKPATFYEVNVEGTRKILEAAFAAGVAKTVFTSTCGVIGPSTNGPLDECHERSLGFSIDYDHSKKQAEEVVQQFVNKGMDIVIVSPSKIFGPGKISHSLTTNAVINSFLKNKMAIVPSPASFKVCFAFLDDVISGHILAMEKGRKGEKYILGGENISYGYFFNMIRCLSGKKGKIYSMPKAVIKWWARWQELNQSMFNKPVRFPAKAVDHFFSNYIFCSSKAEAELGYSITPFESAMEKTIQFLNQDIYA